MSTISPYVYPALSYAPEVSLSIERIIETTCVVTSLTPIEFYAYKRNRDLSEARHIAVYLIRKLTGLPYMKIALHLNNRNHATAMHSYHTCKNLYQTDLEFRHKTNKVIASLSLSPIKMQQLVNELESDI